MYLEVLRAFDFTIKYWPGARNVIADRLSLRPDYIGRLERKELEKEKDKKTEEETDKEKEVELTVAAIDMMVTSQREWLDGVRGQYEEDETFGELVRVLEEKRKCKAIGEWETQVGKKLVDKSRRYTNRDGLLWYREERNRELGEEEQRAELLCVPKGGGLRTALFRDAHDSLTAGHFAADKTYNFLHERYYWPTMKVSVKRYLRGCETCARVKPSNDKKMGLLQPLLPVPIGRWERIGIDFVVGLPKVKDKDAVCTIVDHTTRRAHFITMKEQTSAEDFATIFMKNYFTLHGMPSHIVSDRDPRFLSDFWKAFVRKCGTGLKPSTPFHPQPDGATEKINGILGNYLKAFATTYEDWTTLLPLAKFAYNSFKQKSTQYRPFFADSGLFALSSYGFNSHGVTERVGTTPFWRTICR